MTLLKFICLFIAISYGFTNIGRLYRKLDITAFQVCAMSIGIVGFIFIQFKLY